MKDRITIRDVAKKAGVSLGTASRALNRTGRVSDAAIAAVNQAVRDLNYKPDVVARSLRTRSSGVIGLLVSDLANPLYARIITAAEPPCKPRAIRCWWQVPATREKGKRR